MLFVTTPAPRQYFSFQLSTYLDRSDGCWRPVVSDSLLNCIFEFLSTGRRAGDRSRLIKQLCVCCGPLPPAWHRTALPRRFSRDGLAYRVHTISWGALPALPPQSESVPSLFGACASAEYRPQSFTQVPSPPRFHFSKAGVASNSTKALSPFRLSRHLSLNTLSSTKLRAR